MFLEHCDILHRAVEFIRERSNFENEIDEN